MEKHISVLLEESISALNLKEDSIIVDCTLGYGGHSSYILQRIKRGVLFAFDQDSEAIRHSTNRLNAIGTNFTIIKSNFVNLKEELEKKNVTAVDGILFDLGVSSPQLDDASRGFSYHEDAKLDMRMNRENPLSAYEVVNNYSKEEYRRLSWDISISYGDDVDVARKVALDILRADDRVVIKYREDDREMRQNRNELAKDEKIQEIVNKIEHKKTWIKRIFSRKSKIQADVEKWKEAQAEKIEAKIPKVDCSPSVFLTSLADSSIVVTIRAWTRSEFYWSVLYDVNEKIYKEFPKNGLSFPFPQMDIHVTQSN